MNILGKLTDIVSGGLFGKVVDTVKEYFPPDMNPEQRAELEIKLRQIEHEQTVEINKALSDAEMKLNQRIAEQEGTAGDLLQMPILGRLILFLRGVQRPMWGFFTAYLDFVWFTTSTNYTEQQQTALIVINVLVLGFLFGERTIKNLSPLITQVFGRNNEPR